MDGGSWVNSLVDLEEPGSRDVSGSHSTPDPTIFRPTRHIRTNRKMEDWTLTATRKWVILGDSNVARLPPHSIPDLQVESYPGANFRHAEGILAKTKCNVVVEKVILSFGLNSR